MSSTARRRRFQRRHERLGCAILAASVVLGIVGAFSVVLIASAVGYPVRGAGFVILALAVVFAGALDYLLKRVLGYQSSRASLQALRRDCDALSLRFSAPQ